MNGEPARGRLVKGQNRAITGENRRSTAGARSLPEWRDRRGIHNTAATLAGRCSVYIVRCTDGSPYVGHTLGVHERVKAHNDGRGAAWTAFRRTVELVFQESLRPPSFFAMSPSASTLRDFSLWEQELQLVRSLTSLCRASILYAFLAVGVIEADNYDAALEIARACPPGHTIELREFAGYA